MSSDLIARLERSHDRLLAGVRSLESAGLDAPSALPGWSRRVVLGHLVRNAEASIRVVRASLAGRLVPKYPGGGAGRDRLIREAAAWERNTLISRFSERSLEFVGILTSLAEDDWNRPTIRRGSTIPIRCAAWWRLFEVEVHHWDLDVGYDTSDWTDVFVDEALDAALQGLDDRLPRGRECIVRIDERRSPGGSSSPEVPAGSIVVTGDGRAVVAWLLRPSSPPPTGLRARHPDGLPSQLPDLAPWG